MGYNRELDLAAGVAPPDNVYERATVTTSEALKLPADFKDQWITVRAADADVHVRFGTATLTVALVATSTVTASEPAIATSAGMIIPSGEERHYDLSRFGLQPNTDSDRVWMAHIAAATTGRVKFYRSSDRK